MPNESNSHCPGNPPEAKARVTPAATATAVPPTPAAAPPQPTATQPGGGAAGVITGPNTGSGPSSEGASPGWLALAISVLVTGAGASGVAIKMRRR